MVATVFTYGQLTICIIATPVKWISKHWLESCHCMSATTGIQGTTLPLQFRIISNEKDQEWNKIVVDILWEVVPKPMILFLSYNTNYLPALTSEGVSKFKFNERKPLCHTYVINSHMGTFPTRHQTQLWLLTGQ